MVSMEVNQSIHRMSIRCCWCPAKPQLPTKVFEKWSERHLRATQRVLLFRAAALPRCVVVVVVVNVIVVFVHERNYEKGHTANRVLGLVAMDFVSHVRQTLVLVQMLSQIVQIDIRLSPILLLCATQFEQRFRCGNVAAGFVEGVKESGMETVGRVFVAATTGRRRRNSTTTLLSIPNPLVRFHRMRPVPPVRKLRSHEGPLFFQVHGPLGTAPAPLTIGLQVFSVHGSFGIDLIRLPNDLNAGIIFTGCRSSIRSRGSGNSSSTTSRNGPMQGLLPHVTPGSRQVRHDRHSNLIFQQLLLRHASSSFCCYSNMVACLLVCEWLITGTGSR